MLKQKINRGFTIIEILVVIIIIIIFVFIAWPNITNWTTDRAVKKEVNSFVKYLEEKKSEVQSGKYPVLVVGVRSTPNLWYMTHEQFGIQMKIPAPGWTNRNDKKTGGKSYLNYYKACPCCLDTIDYSKWEKTSQGLYQWGGDTYHWMNSNMCLSKDALLDPGTNHFSFTDSDNQRQQAFVMLCSKTNTSNHYSGGGSNKCNNSSKADHRYIIQMDRSQNIYTYKYNVKKNKWVKK